MAEPRTHGPSGATPRADGVFAEAGFTLAEMLAALTILLFGVTALLGSMSSSVGQRRTADARHELTALCDAIVHRVMQQQVHAPSGDATPLELELRPLADQETPGFPGMRWSCHAVADEDRPELWLLRIEMRWFDANEEVTAEFSRIVPRQLPLRARVSSFRGDNPTSR
jgi:prepilin-type N-terminal cleavage/methylation domain-containing protein